MWDCCAWPPSCQAHAAAPPPGQGRLLESGAAAPTSVPPAACRRALPASALCPVATAAVGTAIEFWKVTKAFDVSIGDSFPYLSIKDKASYMDSRHNTNKHDAQAMRYLSYALYPCVIGVWGAGASAAQRRAARGPGYAHALRPKPGRMAACSTPAPGIPRPPTSSTPTGR